MACYYKNMTATGLVKEGPGKLKGFTVATTTGGTVKIWDAMAAEAPVLLNTITPAAGSNYEFPDIQFTRGLFVTIANTIDMTIYYE